MGNRKNLKLKSFMEIYNVPVACVECGSVMVYRGLGEYCCENCKAIDYDNYGKTRNYIEQNPGASAVDVERKTGVSRSSIREMLKENRFEIAEGARSFLRCEACGKEIRAGRYCHECEKNVHLMIENEHREKMRENMRGFAIHQEAEDGQRRFVRDK